VRTKAVDGRFGAAGVVLFALAYRFWHSRPRHYQGVGH
jgi:hypothetical protein